jgi:hypothetical protein
MQHHASTVTRPTNTVTVRRMQRRNAFAGWMEAP